MYEGELMLADEGMITVSVAAAESLSKFEGESLGFNAPENGQRSSNQLSRIQSGKRGNSIFLTKKLPTLIS
jgi:hypothetical protein